MGCGRGELVIHAALNGAYAVGIDFSPDAITIANNNLKNFYPHLVNSVKFKCADATNLPFQDDSFDLVLMIYLSEHLHPHQFEKALKEAYRVLKKGGVLLIHTENRWSSDIGYRYYSRWVGYPLYPLVNLLTKRNITIRKNPRDEYCLKHENVHLNEQSPFELRKSLGRTKFKYKIWVSHSIPIRFDRISLLLLIYGMIRKLYPLSLFPPLNLFFSDHLWARAIK